MKRILLLGLALAVLPAACDKKKGGDPKAGSGAAGGGAAVADECTATIDNITALQVAEIPKDMPDKQRTQITAMMAKVNPVIVQSCRDTKWSKEATDCMKGLKSIKDVKACEDKLTPEQRDAAETLSKKAAEAAMNEANTPSDDDKAVALIAIAKLRDEMCACKDKACGEAVYAKWGDVEKASEGARHDDATKQAWNVIDDELMACKTKLK